MSSRAFGIALLLWMSGCGIRVSGSATGGPKAPLLAPRVIVGDLDAKVLLGDVPASASKLGAGPLAVVASGESVERERIGAFVVVPEGACLLAYARASSSIDDLDVAAFADAGNSIASDDAPDAHPTILLCPPHPERVYLAAITASGEGLVALAAQLVPPERAAEVGRALGARGARFAGQRAADSWVGLDDHVRVHRESLGGQWEEFRRVAVSVDARVPAYLNFPMEAGTCTDAVIVPDDDVALLEVEAVDDGGHVIARSTGGARDRTLTVCSTLASGGAIVIRPHVGQGLAAVVLGRAGGDVAADLSARPDVVWASGSRPLEVAKNDRNAELAKAGYPPPSVTRTGTLTIGRLFAVPIDLDSGTDGCLRIDLVAGAPLALVHAAVWDEKGALVTNGEGAASVTLFACGHGKARLELEARGRGGPYVLLMRPERWNDPTFARHLLAASRMLARAAAGPSMVFDGSPVAVHEAVLDAAHLSSWDELVPAGKCLRIAAGVEGEGTGLLGRVIERTTGDEMDRAHADRAVAMRACVAIGAPRAVRIELRASAGKLEAVIGERVAD